MRRKESRGKEEVLGSRARVSVFNPASRPPRSPSLDSVPSRGGLNSSTVSQEESDRIWLMLFDMYDTEVISNTGVMAANRPPRLA